MTFQPGAFPPGFFFPGYNISMHESRPSRTALRVALLRAAHQLFDHPKVLDDPFAVPITGDAIQHLHSEPRRYHSRLARHFRAFMVARSRFAEDQLAAAHGRGVRQYVVLGAGLDTSSLRGLAASGALRVFEVDHPNTQAWKRRMLAKAAIPVPSGLSFVPVDFEHQSLPAELASSGFQPAEPAFFSWLGVVPYLSREAAAHTFAFLGNLSAGSGVVFDYAVHRSQLGFFERLALRAVAARVARAGEPFRLYFTPAELAQFLAERNLSRVEQLASPEINARYFAGRSDGLGVKGKAGRIVAAWNS